MSEKFVFARDNFEAVLRRAEEHMTARDAMLLRQNIKQLKDMVGIWDDELAKKTAECDVLKTELAELKSQLKAERRESDLFRDERDAAGEALERIIRVVIRCPTALAGAIAGGDACSQMKAIAVDAWNKTR